MTETSKELRTEISSDGKLKLSIATTPRPVPGDNEVLIKVDAAPINPSDLGLWIGPADVSTLSVSGTGDDAVVTMDIPEAMMKAMTARLDQSLPAGNEGAGEVVA
ncbi:MAG: NADPH2:quinone reductase, partial [Planctomycetaceae bacterium]